MFIQRTSALGRLFRFFHGEKNEKGIFREGSL